MKTIRKKYSSYNEGGEEMNDKFRIAAILGIAYVLVDDFMRRIKTAYNEGYDDAIEYIKGESDDNH